MMPSVLTFRIIFFLKSVSVDNQEQQMDRFEEVKYSHSSTSATVKALNIRVIR
jgi:hypothetical protein